MTTILTRRDPAPAPTPTPASVPAPVPARPMAAIRAYTAAVIARLGVAGVTGLVGLVALGGGGGYRFGAALNSRPPLWAALMQPLAWLLVQFGTVLVAAAALAWLWRRVRGRA